MSTCFIIVFGLGLVGVTSRANVEGAHARTNVACSQADRIHTVIRNETLASIAAYYGFGEQSIVAYNRLSGPNSIYINQSICIPSIPLEDMSSAIRTFKLPRRLAAPLALMKHVAQMSLEKRDQPAAPQFQAVPYQETDLPVSVALHRVPAGYYAAMAPFSMAASNHNTFPVGQCTWWAVARYYQLHDVFVPWSMNADAGEWVDRAPEFGWHVSSVPTVGSILVLQAGVQGASPVGHVAVVEQILNDGTVIASSMNWGNHPGAVTNSLFRVGTGVAFISQSS
ncbi:CHAP domain-containing protein [Dictyobacter kobayashii]|uniref:CHAP domain-containing protein n=1 Tax=Dictyobacter kobayashii TaxID=2014872 RepID=UPI000F8493A1|nr:LysM peptidoglycan-binding domain-containing protein [Dictyobacter kobayashii]